MNPFIRWLRRPAPTSPIRRAVRARAKSPPLFLEPLEDRIQLDATATGFEPIGGVGNNVANPTWGSAGTDLLRISPAAYSDGISSPSLANNPSARVISDILNNQADPNNPSQDIQTVDGNNLSDFGYAFGQFIDHDLDLTTTNPNEILQILADPNDPSQMGNQTFERSTYDPTTGTSTSNPRQQVNSVSSYLDLSQVYGSTPAIADALRTHTGGQLKTSPGNMLPYDNSTYFTPDQLAVINMANDSGAVSTQNLFVTGDVRGNENVELTTLQTLFVRNHNLIASQLQKEHPDWSDEQLYQEARKINIAEYQNIVYTQYLPDVLGPNAIPQYQGYNPNVNPSIATEFSTVAFRYGHSLLSSNIERQGNNGQDVLPNDPAGASISLATDYFDPNVLNPAGVTDPLTGHISTDIGPILKGDADGNSQASDLLAINDIRNLLFANGGLQDNGQDLMARDVERARDNGIGTYNQVREAYGLPAVTSFAQITSNVQVQQELQKAYGTVDNIDPFEGGLAEDHVPGSDVGPLFTAIIADQFTRLRDGDRFFYLNEQWTPDEMNIMHQGDTLAKIIEANTNVTNLQPDVFVFQASISGTVTAAPSGGGKAQTPPPGVPGITVQLQDTSGNVLATTKTDAQGHYLFNQQSGPAANPDNAPGVSAVGSYNIVLVLPSGYTQTSANPAPVNITNGDTHVTGVDFVVNTGSTMTPPPGGQGQGGQLPPPPSGQGQGGQLPPSGGQGQSSPVQHTQPPQPHQGQNQGGQGQGGPAQSIQAQVAQDAAQVAQALRPGGNLQAALQALGEFESLLNQSPAAVRLQLLLMFINDVFSPHPGNGANT
jgi:peroxidase